ncbi:unnamed protein product [marine sediment metagenome]|uniref:Methyltransferase domain-containing protein n=1 Tax=marine sediment metagenome TaxID=412755 RepID=X1A029_9ZZZZ
MELVAGLVEGKSLLEVACGLGHLYPFVKNKVENYLGTDNSPAMIKKAIELQPNVNFKYGDIYDLSPFGKYDTVCCLNVLIHLPTSDNPIKEMWKHAGRCLIFSVPLSTSLKHETQRYGDGYVIFRWETWENILRIIGQLNGVKKVEKYPQEIRVRTGLKGRNSTIKVVRKSS